MPVVDVAIGKRIFQLVCGEGQENHLQGLATEVTKKVSLLSESMDNSSDTLLLVMASLMMQDELNELKSGASSNENEEKAIDSAIADTIATISEYIDTVADRIEQKAQ